MTGRQLKIVLDTNIWLDMLFGNRPGNAIATQLASSATSTQSLVLYAITSLKDVFFLAAQYLKQLEKQESGSVSEAAAIAANEAAWACVQNMLENATPVAMDYSDAWLAAKFKAIHNDFEDDLLIAALKRANADYLVTTDQQLIKRFPQEAISPQEAIELLGQGA